MKHHTSHRTDSFSLPYLITLFTLLFPSFSTASPLPQQLLPSTTQTALSTTTTATSTKTKLLPLYILAGVGVAALACGLLYMFRRRLVSLFKKPSSTNPTSNNTNDTALETTQTNTISATSSRISLGITPLSAPLLPTPTPRPTVGGVSNADRTASQQRRTRRSRRPASVVGLPIYTEDPNQDELVLVKHRPKYSGGIDVLSYERSRDSSLDYEDEFDEGEEGDGDESTRSLMPDGGRPSMDDRERPSMEEGVRGNSFDVQGRSRSASDALSYSSRRPPSPDRIRDAVDIIAPSLSPLITSSTSSSPSTSSHRLTQSLSIPTTSQSSNNFPSPSSSPQSVIVNRSRGSTLRSIFNRTGTGSSSFLPLGSSSHGGVPDPIGAGAGRSPYGQGSPAGSRSTARLASSSSVSVSSLNISAPLQHTLVHSQFVFPKNGLTPSQIAFISSRESLGAYGYGPGSEPLPYDETVRTSLDLSSPSSSPTNNPNNLSPTGIPTRGRRSSSVTSVRSPLGPGGSSSPSSPTVPPPVPAQPFLPPDSPPPEYPPSTSFPFAPSIPTPPPLSPIRTANLFPPASSSMTRTPSSSSATSSSSRRGARNSTGGPPQLPAIEFLSATPTSSAAPSPVLPHQSSGFSHASRGNQVSTISEGNFVEQNLSDDSEDYEDNGQSFSTAQGGSRFL